MYAYVVAVPTADDLEAGARWWRCDTYATEREGRLAPLTSSTEDVLAGDDADQWATCVQGALGTGQRQVMCREQHDWRAISAHRLGESADEFPGSDEIGDEIRRTCQADVRAYVDDPLDGFDYGWLRPTGPDWREGQRFALCFTKTSSLIGTAPVLGPVTGPDQKPSFRSWRGSRCQSLATLTCRSRKTGVPRMRSICTLDCDPICLSRSPRWPITMPFWLSRST